ncbi:MAG TPA: NAD(P)H-hydrate dehydratase [Salinimicrobium sp.]|nr:NAD(P)H-hydrate dehydratase [Salinimicrobium sp.]
MKIFTAAQFKQANKITTEKQGVTLEALMERTSTIVFKEMHNRLKGSPGPIKVICGVGNNGGDGLVIAKHLIQHGYYVDVYILNCSDKRSKNFLNNYHKIKEVTKNWPTLLKQGDEFPKINTNDFVVDAIFGSGLNRPLDGWVGEFIRHVNASGAFILSIDMPSGLYWNKIPKKKDAIIRANFTLSFQSPKLVFFLPEVAEFAGEVEVIDIGLDREFLRNEITEAHLIGKNEVQPLYISRKKNSHKGDYGHALIVGGSYGKIGSIGLTSLAAMRTGTGLVTAFIPACGYEILQGFVPEAMVLTDKEEKLISSVEFNFVPEVICFGVGAGKETVTYEAFKNLLLKTKKPMVIDADGLNLLNEHPDLLKSIPEHSVLTPHPKELERLLGKWKDDFDKLKKAREFVAEHNIVLIIKGAYTFIVTKERTYINNSGNPGMATAGSGDVLAGMVTGLISQGYEPLNAAVFGVYLHGKAGDIAARNKGQQALIARDIIENIGLAFLSLFEKPQTPSTSK